MCSERDSPLEPFVLPAPGQPEPARLTCGAHLGPPVLTRKQKRPRVNSLVCDRAAAFCAAGPPEALFWMSRLVTQAAKHERELARVHSQRLKQATLSLPGESVSRGFADRGALEGYPSHYTSLVWPSVCSTSSQCNVAPLAMLTTKHWYLSKIRSHNLVSHKYVNNFRIFLSYDNSNQKSWAANFRSHNSDAKLPACGRLVESARDAGGGLVTGSTAVQSAIRNM